MKKLFLILALLPRLLLAQSAFQNGSIQNGQIGVAASGGGGGATWTLVAHTNASAAVSGGTATSGAIDTTGAKFLAVTLNWAGGGPVVFSDNKANTWTTSVNYTNNNPKVQWYFVTNATGGVGSGHTFSASCPGLKISFHVYAFSVTSGQPTVDVEAAGARTSSWLGNILSPGSLTPSTANDLFLSSVAWDVNTATTVTNNANFIYTEPLTFTGAGFMSGYKIHVGDASAENPGWLQFPTANDDADANHIAFKLQ